jgi:tRNA pseudouridine synthase 10
MATIERPAVSCLHAPIYVAGRYFKFARNISQTPWVVDGATKGSGSVSDLISVHFLPHFRASEAKFSSAGREDCDVRMLGTGRPFYLEFLDPHVVSMTPQQLDDVQVLFL